MDTAITMAALSPVLVGIVQVIKTIGIPTKFLPLLNLALGVSFSLFFLSGTPQILVLQGLIMGLSAGGFYDLIKDPAIAIKNKLTE